ncbi:MAG: hypothetical protein KDB80_14760, partial [Planctomycetes bacterium]|nr:hypothetical protein [Planctomycetota bacterium]
MKSARALLVLALASTAGCISFDYSHASVGSPVDDATLEVLEPGRTDLSTCLATLGAPELVWPS